VRTTILRGHVLIEDGTFVGSAAHGQYLTRQLTHSWDAPAALGEGVGGVSKRSVQSA